MLLEVGLAGGESPGRGPHFPTGWQQPQRLRLGWCQGTTQRYGADARAVMCQALFSVLSKGGKQTRGIGCPWSCPPWSPGGSAAGPAPGMYCWSLSCGKEPVSSFVMCHLRWANFCCLASVFSDSYSPSRGLCHPGTGHTLAGLQLSRDAV